jgi:hypothetical protein
MVREGHKGENKTRQQEKKWQKTMQNPAVLVDFVCCLMAENPHPLLFLPPSIK